MSSLNFLKEGLLFHIVCQPLYNFIQNAVVANILKERNIIINHISIQAQQQRLFPESYKNDWQINPRAKSYKYMKLGPWV